MSQERSEKQKVASAESGAATPPSAILRYAKRRTASTPPAESDVAPETVLDVAAPTSGASAPVHEAVAYEATRPSAPAVGRRVAPGPPPDSGTLEPGRPGASAFPAESAPPPSGSPTPSADAPSRPEARRATVVSENDALELPGYHVIKMFGQGGMGEVFLADRVSSTGVSVRCVVKTIREGVGDRDQFRSLFLDEARTVSHLRHPNIVSIIDVGQAGGRLYLAMEWIDGLDVDSLYKRSTAEGAGVPLRHLLYLLRETLQGLHYAHTAKDADGRPMGIVHRDISPGNILISRHGAVKLADFGVAVSSAAHTAGSAESLAGKPHYFAPELWRGSPASPATDIFALGVTFYEIFRGQPLFSRKVALQALAFEICEFSVDELVESDLTIPDGLEHIIRRSLHEDAEERYSSALEFLEDVNDYAYEAGIRLLDAHFADYIAGLLEPFARRPSGGRRSIWKD